MAEELGDLLLQVVFHCQLARERGAFDFEKVTRHLVDKLIRRHPHVFGTTKVKNVDEVWANWEKIKKAEKHGTQRERQSALDGIPKHLPALLRAEKLLKKARKAKVACGRPRFKAESSPKLRWRKNFLNWRRSPRRAAGARRNCWPAKSRRRERQFRRPERTNLEGRAKATIRYCAFDLGVWACSTSTDWSGRRSFCCIFRERRNIYDMFLWVRRCERFWSTFSIPFEWACIVFEHSA